MCLVDIDGKVIFAFCYLNNDCKAIILSCWLNNDGQRIDCIRELTVFCIWIISMIAIIA